MWKDSDETIYLSIQMDFQESIVFINNSFRVVIFLDEFLLIHLAKYIHPGIYCILPLHQVPLVYKEKRYFINVLLSQCQMQSIFVSSTADASPGVSGVSKDQKFHAKSDFGSLKR